MKFCLVARFTTIFQADLSNRSWFPNFYQHALYTMYYNVLYDTVYIYIYTIIYVYTCIHTDKDRLLLFLVASLFCWQQKNTVAASPHIKSDQLKNWNSCWGLLDWTSLHVPIGQKTSQNPRSWQMTKPPSPRAAQQPCLDGSQERSSTSSRWGICCSIYFSDFRRICVRCFVPLFRFGWWYKLWPCSVWFWIIVTFRREIASKVLANYALILISNGSRAHYMFTLGHIEMRMYED